MIAKLIVSAESRDTARRRAIDALQRYPILGVRTNVAFLIELLGRPELSADKSTPASSTGRVAASRRGRPQATCRRRLPRSRPRSGRRRTGRLRRRANQLHWIRGLRCGATVAETVTVRPLGNGRFHVSAGGRQQLAYAAAVGADTWVFINGVVHVVEGLDGRAGAAGRRRGGGDEHAALAAPMPATVASVNVTSGQLVARGDVLVMLEAMKMELPIKAPRDGMVTAVSCRAGDLVQPGVRLVELE